MTPDRRDREGCLLCARPRSEGRGGGDEEFCCGGCRAVYTELVADEPRRRDGDRTTEAEPDRNAVSDRAGLDGDGEYVRTYLRVDGMHRVTCETYLESLSIDCDGVYDAEASYVTETIRIDHDPDRVSATTLRDALSRTGYTAYLRDDATGTDDETGTTRRSREMTGLRSRRTWDMLEGRYIAGIVFGMFVLLQYLVIFYPMSVPYVYDEALVGVFERALASPVGVMFYLMLFTLTGFVLYVTGMPLLRGAYVSLKLRRPTTDLLVAVAAVAAFGYSVAATALRRVDVYYDLTIAIVVVVMAGLYYEASVKRRAMDRLTELTISQVGTARLLEADGTTDVDVADVSPGDRLLVREGERIPVDGVLAEGQCTVDEAVITGENLPVAKQAGDDLVGGSVVTNGAAVVTVGPTAESSIDRLTTVVWNLQSADHGVQQRADELASRLVPAVAATAVLVGFGSLAFGTGTTGSVLAVLLALVVVSPWVLGLATPLSVATSIREATDRGIVVFDESIFERLRGIDVVVFDKTGTLTTGEMDVLETDAPPDLLEAAAVLERRATHPAADAIVAAFDTRDEDATRADGGVHDDRVADVRSHETGIEGTVDGTDVLVGHPDLFVERGWELADELATRAADARGFGRLPVVVGRDGVAEGIVVVGDEPRAGWDETVTALAERDIETVVLTGDDEAATAFFDRHLDVDHVFADVPPAGKTEAIRRLQTDGRVAMVGDGTNDAPALAAADLGISLGSGTALASDAADLAIVEDDLGAVETAFDLATAARKRLERSVGLALVFNAIAIPLAVAGALTPLGAIAAAVVSTLLVGINVSGELV
ncbi:heavy metal translocating P-type ATPase [Natrialbaceae archaeon AArc-T1-2]|uniref:heavy metal translocating P-type ATPase n=1 Tax=Natrialbaceae archaeon AArc-T1-2 TaxID=3053904 RepID=UPI00255B0658|nr:cation-translocating P-type ATPase [Natrialbaceae archaeon AArc-T1-2]WIV67676.1 cation-translocating P-type ATPase [Natrialbaceae archaeon AArc-T1-2]